jgi:predicted nucleic acid-binding protein
LDTNIYIKYLSTDEQDESAVQLIADALVDEKTAIVAPAWAWAEVGSVLRKKVRANLLLRDEAEGCWQDFLSLSITFIESELLRQRSWELAHIHQLPTLYDAAFLACVEVVPPLNLTKREFWTADLTLLNALGTAKSAYVMQLS